MQTEIYCIFQSCCMISVFIFHQILWIVINLSLWCQCWQKPDFIQNFFQCKRTLWFSPCYRIYW